MAGTRLPRLLRLITLLQSGQAQNPDQLAEELGVHRRTVFRDLDLLRKAGIPCFFDQGDGYRVAERFFLPPVNLTIPETLGLLLLGKSAEGSRDQPLGSDSVSAIRKLISAVPEPMRSACLDVMSNVTVQPSARVPGDVETRYHRILQSCIDEGRICRIRYRPARADEDLELELHPYALHFAARAWYVYGWTPHFDDVRVFKLVRLGGVELTESYFTPPRDFKVADKIGKAWLLIPEGKVYKIELRFAPRVARNVMEVSWHPSQKQSLRRDGWATVRFEVDGLGEIAWWVCGYADQVRVIKPKKLADMVCAMHQRAAAGYDA
ncbi:helix-turn-helix transcriptional regulator [Mucisphaera calidilacus]|uniref:HTH domain protein n=1 Tax=Mucisphaera calidilacus TaxID=2527982 RepID=A0A518BW05_9BACT|nr:WYL domain-containing protein [Mucisphaera calidilacus]QDU71141.1 HTH domain protein [Mucisphaera calidilacus]